MKTIPEGFRANRELREKLKIELGIDKIGGKFAGEMIWESCPKCNIPRWVRINKIGKICRNCNKQVRLIKVDGYEVLSREDFHKKFGIWKRGSQIFYPCKKCGEYHWIGRSDLFKKTATGICRKCFNKYMAETTGDDRWNWKGKVRRKLRSGYVEIRINKNDEFSSMAKHRCLILEHRYVMAKSLNRLLEKWELVHHINGVKDDNRIENLEIVTLKNHRGELVCPHCGKPYKIQ